MKTWFPLTDYDFYAYIASGSLLIAAADRAWNAGEILARDDWSFVAIIVFFSTAYVAGHLVAAVSSPVIEHWLARTVLTPPGVVQLGLKPRTRMERFVGEAVGRYYEPFKPATIDAIKANATAELGGRGNLDFEDIFQAAHRRAYAAEHSRDRAEQFRNQYGFCRNVAFVSYLGVVFFSLSSAYGGSLGPAWPWIIVSAVVAVLMTVRFLKFYACFCAEILRALIKQGEPKT